MLFSTGPREAPAQVLLLLNHLDVIVATGEELLGRSQGAETMAVGQAAEQFRVLGAGRAPFLADIVRLETIIVGRLLQARRWAGEAVIKDSAARAAVRLFQAASAMLADKVGGDRPSEAGDFNAGADAFAYMRRRALIARDAMGASLLDRIEVTRDFRIWGLVPLGDAIDAARAARAALTIAYRLPASDAEEPGFDVLLDGLRKAS